MYMLIRYGEGAVVEAIALAAGKKEIRVISPFFQETVTLTLHHGIWTDEVGQAVEFDCVIPLTESQQKSIRADSLPARMHA